ncbi:MAG: hypothetical protein ACYTGC_20730 [Planctomycetota bacterium]|jgi:hypothetical protein
MAVYVVVEQDDDDQQLAPGMFMRGTVLSSRSAPRWVVPRQAVADDRILVVADGVVSSRSVKVDFHLEGRFPELGLADTQWVVLDTPLVEGEQIVANASRVLAEGTPVLTARAGGVMAANPDDESSSVIDGGGAP